MPSEDELSTTGLTLEDFAGDDFDVWPCCWRSVTFFESMGHGAWDHGVNGPSRLDYQAVVNILFDHHSIKKKHRRALFSDLQIMEIPALNAMRSK